jgi:large subunit ribosomal protein L18
MFRAKELAKKEALRLKRKKRIRAKVFGTVEAPRLTVFKSNKFLYAQAIDDNKSHTIVAVNGLKEGLKANKEEAKKLAGIMAERLKTKNIETVIFDRNGYKYHGVVASFADALRENGIKV